MQMCGVKAAALVSPFSEARKKRVPIPLSAIFNQWLNNGKENKKIKMDSS